VNNAVWKKITWAVDVFANTELQCSAKSALRLMVGEAEVPIEPVYVLNRAPIGLRRQLPEKAMDELERSAKERFDQMCLAPQVSYLLPLRILAGSFTTRHAGAQALIRDSREHASDLIVASTSARRGPMKWFTGSFVESLMLYSELPLLVVNPLWKQGLEHEEILFPTDFSDESRRAFEMVFDLARRMKSEIILFHKIPFLLTPVYELAGYPIYNEVYQSQIEFAESKGKEWIADAAKQGITVRMKMQTSLAGSPASAILKFSENKNYLIAMAARSGPIAAALLGSTTREVVRGSSSPVWVVHPSAVAAETPARQAG
jgi:nucleotide-binding universal stress UspA family protein